MKNLAFFLALIIGSSSISAHAEDRSCEKRTKVAFPGFELTAGSTDIGSPAHNPTKRYSTTTGDYDGDGRRDHALLLRSISENDKRAISVCLSSKPSGPPSLIHDVYTAAPLSTTPKGREYYDFSTDAKGIYELDGIGSYYYECCGATYILRNGAFAEIVDSD